MITALTARENREKALESLRMTDRYKDVMNQIDVAIETASIKGFDHALIKLPNDIDECMQSLIVEDLEDNDYYVDIETIYEDSDPDNKTYLRNVIGQGIRVSW